MSLYTEFADMVKEIAVNAVEAGRPADITFGRVYSLDPFSVEIMEGVAITGNQIVLSERLKGHNLSIELADGEKTAVVDPSLREGDRLILVRKKGGQTYYAIDRVPGDVRSPESVWGGSGDISEEELYAMLAEVFSSEYIPPDYPDIPSETITAEDLQAMFDEVFT